MAFLALSKVASIRRIVKRSDSSAVERVRLLEDEEVGTVDERDLILTAAASRAGVRAAMVGERGGYLAKIVCDECLVDGPSVITRRNEVW